jgi:hypothetical protein
MSAYPKAEQTNAGSLSANWTPKSKTLPLPHVVLKKRNGSAIGRTDKQEPTYGGHFRNFIAVRHGLLTPILLALNYSGSFSSYSLARWEKSVPQFNDSMCLPSTARRSDPQSEPDGLPAMAGSDSPCTTLLTGQFTGPDYNLFFQG